MQRIQVVKSWARQTNGVLTAGTFPVGANLQYQINQALADPLWPSINRVAIMIGANDTAFSVATWVAALLVQLGRINKPIDLMAAPPRADAVNTAVGGDGMQGWAWFLEVRAQLKRIAEANPRIKFIDAYSTVNSPLTIPDVILSTRVLPDTIHPNNAGAFLIADAYVNSLFPSGMSGDIDIWPNNAYADSAGANGVLDQAFQNPNFATATGGTAGAGVTLGAGQIAGSLTLTGIAGGTVLTPTTALSTIPGSTGNMQTIPITSTASGDGVAITNTVSLHNVGTTFLASGDQAYLQCFMRINSGGIYPRNLFARLLGFNGTTNYFNNFHDNATPANEIALPLTGTRTFLIRTPIFLKSGAALTALNLRIAPTFAGAGACTIDISNLEVRRLKSGGIYS
jgi:lysophospholipase L1-like esterase